MIEFKKKSWRLEQVSVWTYQSLIRLINWRLKWAKIQNSFWLLLRLVSFTLKPATFEDVYLPPVANEASGGRTLNNNQLYKIEQLFYTNHQFFLEENNSIFKCSKKYSKKSKSLPILGICIWKTLEGNNFFIFVNLREDRYIIMV